VIFSLKKKFNKKATLYLLQGRLRVVFLINSKICFYFHKVFVTIDVVSKREMVL